jgi:hypothetical protein
MELLKINDEFIVTYQRQGSNKNGHPIYIINFFQDCYNVNYKTELKKDKNDNIKCVSFSIEDTIFEIYNEILNFKY